MCSYVMEAALYMMHCLVGCSTLFLLRHNFSPNFRDHCSVCTA